MWRCENFQPLQFKILNDQNPVQSNFENCIMILLFNACSFIQHHRQSPQMRFRHSAPQKNQHHV